MRFLARKRQIPELPISAYPLPKNAPLGECLVDAIANRDISPELTKALIVAAKERSLDELTEAAKMIDKDNVLNRISQKGGPYRSRSEYISDAEDISEKGTEILLAAISEKAGQFTVPDWKESVATFKMKSIRAAGYAIRGGLIAPYVPLVLMEKYPVLGFLGLIAGGCGAIIATEKLGFGLGTLLGGYVAVTATAGIIIGAILGWHEKCERIRQSKISPDIGPILERLPGSIKESICKIAPGIRALLSEKSSERIRMRIANPSVSDDETVAAKTEGIADGEGLTGPDERPQLLFSDAEEAGTVDGDGRSGSQMKT